MDGYYFRCKLTNGFGNVSYTDAGQGYILAFTQQPESLSVVDGDLASLAVTSSFDKVTYTWERSYDGGTTWSVVPGEVYSVLLVNSTMAESSALYRCVITAANGDALASDTAEIKIITPTTKPMHRLYNPNSGEHFYTGSIEERDTLVGYSWQYEGVAWNAPTQSGDPVYRLFNPNNGDHHYTMSAVERDNLVAVGWQYEGVAWNSASDDHLPLYRLFNPNADCGSHHYTGSTEERDFLVSVGWIYEGIGWFGLLN